MDGVLQNTPNLLNYLRFTNFTSDRAVLVRFCNDNTTILTWYQPRPLPDPPDRVIVLQVPGTRKDPSTLSVFGLSPVLL